MNRFQKFFVSSAFTASTAIFSLNFTTFTGLICETVNRIFIIWPLVVGIDEYY